MVFLAPARSDNHTSLRTVPSSTGAGSAVGKAPNCGSARPKCLCPPAAFRRTAGIAYAALRAVRWHHVNVRRPTRNPISPKVARLRNARWPGQGGHKAPCSTLVRGRPRPASFRGADDPAGPRPMNGPRARSYRPERERRRSCSPRCAGRACTRAHALRPALTAAGSRPNRGPPAARHGPVERLQRPGLDSQRRTWVPPPGPAHTAEQVPISRKRPANQRRPAPSRLPLRADKKVWAEIAHRHEPTPLEVDPRSTDKHTPHTEDTPNTKTKTIQTRQKKKTKQN